MISSAFLALVIRTILIITITDAVIFYVMVKRSITPTIPFAISVIMVTIIPLIISLWFVLVFKAIS